MESKGDPLNIALGRCRFQRADPYKDIYVLSNATSAVMSTYCSGFSSNITLGYYPDFKERGQLYEARKH